jgi:hypothetical protein
MPESKEQRAMRCLVFALLCLITAPAALAAPECTTLPASDFQLRPLSADTVDQETASPEQIARLSPGGPDGAPHPLLAVRYTFDSNVGLVHRLVPAKGGGFCAAPEAVTFGFGITRRRAIFVPAAALDACVKSALLAHEAEHYRVVSEAIRAFLHRQEATLTRYLGELKARPAAGETAAKSAMESGLLGASARLIEQFNRNEVARIREQIDSPGHLAALSASCNGRIGALEHNIRRGEAEL